MLITLDKPWPLPKYNGEDPKKVIDTDPGYIEWVRNTLQWVEFDAPTLAYIKGEAYDDDDPFGNDNNPAEEPDVLVQTPPTIVDFLTGLSFTTEKLEDFFAYLGERELVITWQGLTDQNSGETQPVRYWLNKWLLYRSTELNKEYEETENA